MPQFRLISERITIVTAANDSYSLCLAVMLRSLEYYLDLNKCDYITVFVFEDGLSESSKHWIRSSLVSGALDLHFLKVYPGNTARLRISHHVTKETYFRLLIENMLFAYNKVIYLDADMVVLRDISDLWNIPFNNSWLLAAPEVSKEGSFAGSKSGIASYREVGMSPSAPIFNAGVMVIDLKKWRENNVSQRVIDYLFRYKNTVRWWDQEGLNVILVNKWTPLQHQWNVLNGLFRDYKQWNESRFSRCEYELMANAPYIIHYNTNIKPWHKDYPYPLREYFFAFVDQTVWRNWRP
jgi:lipopolysaccharide biosynthesis glycosyltransferase